MRMTVDDLLIEARGVLRHRPGPAKALAAQAAGALLVDIRSDDQRRADGLVPGALVLPRNSLEWHCDPASQWWQPEINDWARPLIPICDEGFQSSLAAATLHRLGPVNATDLDGGLSRGLRPACRWRPGLGHANSLGHHVGRMAERW
jgi:rhodanese-related sulfurtransferase